MKPGAIASVMLEASVSCFSTTTPNSLCSPSEFLVDEAKDAGGRAKPFHTVIERPDSVGGRKPIKEALN